MPLFITTKVELRTDILDYVPGATNLDEKCHKLEEQLKKTCQSISLRLVDDGKLELCGQWDDIVRCKEVLNSLLECKISGKEGGDLSEAIHLREEAKNNGSTTTQQKVAAPDNAECQVNTSGLSNVDEVRPRARKRRKVSTTAAVVSYSRPKRNIKHKILPLLKTKRKHFDVGLSSDSEDEVGLDDVLAEDVKQEDEDEWNTDADLRTISTQNINEIKRDEQIQSVECPENNCIHSHSTMIEDGIHEKQEAASLEIKSKESTNEDCNTIDINTEATVVLPSTNSEDVKQENVKSAPRITDPRMKDLISRSGEYYHCSKCTYKAQSITNIKLHVVRVHLPKSFHCDQCTKSYALHKDLLSHKTVHTKPHTCHYCSLSFSKPYLLRQHIKCRHEGISKKRGQKQRKQITKSGTSIPLGCRHCDYMTFHNWNLVAHLQRVHAKKVYKCSECNSAFGLMKDLNQHKKLHFKTFECQKCKKVLKNAYSLKMHMKAIHEGVKLTPAKSYQCELCGKVCRNKTDYNVHMNKAHLNCRPFKCEQCGMEFFAKVNLTAHQLIHSNEAKFVCPECGKRFKQRQGLCIHRNIHKPVEDRPFKCDSCNKVFTQQGALVRHQRLHSGLRPYLCKFDPNTCNASFNDYSVLRRHLQGIHKVHDVRQLQQAVQKACDESRAIIAAHSKNLVSDVKDNKKRSDPEREYIMHEQKLQARRLKNSQQSTDHSRNILVKVEGEGHLGTEDIQFTSLQKLSTEADLKLIAENNSTLDVVTHNQQLQELVTEYGSRIPVLPSSESRICLYSSPDGGIMTRPIVRVMYLGNDSIKPKESMNGDVSEKIPGSLEEAVKEALSGQPTSEDLSQVNEEVFQLPLQLSDAQDPASGKPVSVMEPTSGSVESIIRTTGADQDAANTTITLQPIITLQAQVRNAAEAQLLNIQGNSSGQSLESSEQESGSEEPAGVNRTKVVLEQMEGQSGQIRMSILTDVSQQTLQNTEVSDDTEQIIVITSIPGDQQPDINAILSMYQQGSLAMSEDMTRSVRDPGLSGTQIDCQSKPTLSYNEANGILGTMVTQNLEHNKTD